MNPEVERIPVPNSAALDGKVLLRLWLEKYDIGIELKDYELLGLKMTVALVAAYKEGLSTVLDAVDEHVQSIMKAKLLMSEQNKKAVAKKKTKKKVVKKKVAKKKAKKKKLALTPKLPSTDDL